MERELKENEKSSISIKHWGNVHTTEFWNCDVDGDQFTEAFAGLMRAAGFHDGCAERCFQHFLEERGYQVYSPEELEEYDEDNQKIIITKEEEVK